MTNDTRRIIAFGCSYTNYISGPTWADFLKLDFKNADNWGMPGIGCRAIAERVAEYHARNGFRKDDVVIVQWTTHLRHDYHTHNDVHDEPGLNNMGWKTAGSIYNDTNAKFHDKKFMKQFFYEPSYIMHCLNHMVLVQELLKNIGCEWYMTSIGDWCKLSTDLDYLTGNFEKPHEKELSIQKNIPEFMPWVDKIWGEHADHWLYPIALHAMETPEEYLYFRDIRAPQKRLREMHPAARQHVTWLNKYLRPKLGLGDPPEEQMKWVESLEYLAKKHHWNQKHFWDVITKPTLENPDLWWPNTDEIWPPPFRGY